MSRFDFGRYCFFVDLGVRLQVSSGTLRSLDIVFPAEVSARDMSCLSKLVLDEDLNNLIFGVRATSNDNRISYSSTSADQDRVDDAVVLCKSLSRNTSVEEPAVYTLELNSAVQAKAAGTESVYLRFRVPISEVGRLWQGRGWGFAKRGVATDIRVVDIRETGSERAWDQISGRILDIPKAFMFLIVPPDYVPSVTSPAQHYVRLLEGAGWEKYLSNCTGAAKNKSLTIHQWRNREQSGSWHTIKPDAPFRTYVYLKREFGPDIFLVYLMGIIGGVLGSLLLKIFETQK